MGRLEKPLLWGKGTMNSKNAGKVVVRAAVSLVLLTWLALSVNWEEVLPVLKQVDLHWIGLAVLWIVASMVVSVHKWWLVLQAQGLHLPGWELWKAYWAGLFCNNFLPSSIGGDALRIIWVRGLIRDTAGAVTSVVVERILATAGLALAGLLGALVVAGSDWQMIILFTILIGASLLLMILILTARVPGWVEKKDGKAASFIKGLAGHGSRLQVHRGKLGLVLVQSVVFQVCVVGVNYSIIQALRLSAVGWWEALYVIPVTSVAAMIPAGINGYGLREGAYVALLGLYGVPRGLALTSSLLFAFTVSLCSLYGGLIWLTRRAGSEGIDGTTGVEGVSSCPGRNETGP